MRIQLFCRVVDNFGDIGVCWRLARCWRQDYHLEVELFVDDLISFQRIQPDVDPTRETQSICAVQIHRWHDSLDWERFACADLVVEAFACQLPPQFIENLSVAARSRQIYWLNLEYLSAEKWIESCHGLPSVDPQTGIKKYFFFPGFSPKVGGLNFEPHIAHHQREFLCSESAQRDVLDALGIDVLRRPDVKIISLFCYPTAPLDSLFAQLCELNSDVHVIVPIGVADDFFNDNLYFANWLRRDEHCYQKNQVWLHRISFTDQARYDKLLWLSDLNFVRGEDSFIRAQLAAHPMVWHIYPQDESAHLDKLSAFNELYCELLPEAISRDYKAFVMAWNKGQSLPAGALSFLLNDVSLQKHVSNWRDKIVRQGDLAGQILQFVQEIR